MQTMLKIHVLVLENLLDLKKILLLVEPRIVMEVAMDRFEST